MYKRIKERLFFIIVIVSLSILTYSQENSPTETTDLYKTGNFKIGKNMKENQNLKLDINSAQKGEMLGAGLSSRYVDKIIEYREITGGFKELDELKRISGIGEKTYKKIVDYFVIDTDFKEKKFLINESDEKTLKYFGLSNKEIKNIIKMRKEGKFITNNRELKDSLNSESTYQSIRDRVDYRVK